MATPTIVFGVACWILASTMALCSAIYSSRRKSIADILAISFISGGFAFGFVGYLARGDDGIAGNELYYLFISVAVGAFGRRIYEFIDKRIEQILTVVFGMFRLPEGGKDDDGKDDTPAVGNDSNRRDSGSNKPLSPSPVENRGHQKCKDNKRGSGKAGS